MFLKQSHSASLRDSHTNENAGGASHIGILDFVQKCRKTHLCASIPDDLGGEQRSKYEVYLPCTALLGKQVGEVRSLERSAWCTNLVLLPCLSASATEMKGFKNAFFFGMNTRNLAYLCKYVCTPR